VRVHYFIDEQLGKVIPHGVYDTERNEAWVSVGVDHALDAAYAEHPERFPHGAPRAPVPPAEVSINPIASSLATLDAAPPDRPSNDLARYARHPAIDADSPTAFAS